MVAMPKTRITTVTMTLWESDEPVGECSLNERHQLVIHAANPDRQKNLIRWVRTKYHMYAKMAREDGQLLNPSQFLEDLPRYLHGLLRYATRPSRASDIPTPSYIPDIEFDLANVSIIPRRTIRRNVIG